MCVLTLGLGNLRSRQWCSTWAASCSIGTPDTSTASSSSTNQRWNGSLPRSVLRPGMRSTTAGSRPRHRAPSLASRHPELSKLIWAWSNRSEEMIGGVDSGSVEVLRAVRESGLPCYALTNMEAETYPLRLKRFPFLGWFDGTVVSGREGVAKPEPAIFRRLLDRFGLPPNTTLMIDDNEENLEAASKLGIQTTLFCSAHQLRAELVALGLLARSPPAT